MTPNFHFIAGLPRSGATLLGALLRQNPSFRASMSSPVAGLSGACVELMSPGRVAAHLVTTEQMRAIVRGVVDSDDVGLAGDAGDLRREPAVARATAAAGRAVPGHPGHRLRARRPLGDRSDRTAGPPQSARQHPLFGAQRMQPKRENLPAPAPAPRRPDGDRWPPIGGPGGATV